MKPERNTDRYSDPHTDPHTDHHSDRDTDRDTALPTEPQRSNAENNPISLTRARTEEPSSRATSSTSPSFPSSPPPPSPIRNLPTAPPETPAGPSRTIPPGTPPRIPSNVPSSIPSERSAQGERERTSPLPLASSDPAVAEVPTKHASNPSEATHSYIDELELLREDYYDLLSDLYEQAQELQREENKNFFTTFFKQQQETSPVTKNIFFELLEQAHADGHTHGDYHQILAAAREYSQQLVANSLKQLPPAQLAALLGEASINDLTTYLTSQQAERPALVTDTAYRTDQGAEDIIL
ncbi:hypothetical protein COTS27_01037 [Spirochaetota bacterium]|nr:hypothetical protein COTS27_01037 [Spirochaetota bacterium]